MDEDKLLNTMVVLILLLFCSLFANFKLYTNYRSNNKTIASKVQEISKLDSKVKDLESKNTSLLTQISDLESSLRVAQEPSLIEKYYSNTLQSSNNDSYLCEGYATVCNDDSCSNSTGSGTCSWHGGIQYYN